VATVFFALLVGHAICDYPLQAGPMATEKCRRSASPLQRTVPWYYWLSAHAVIHGGAVYLITGSLFLGLAETVIHWLIDFGKCEDWFGIHVDQALHVGCKVLWCVLMAYGVPGMIDPHWPLIPRPLS
jgi:Protein of unknown function (DUF3307)